MCVSGSIVLGWQELIRSLHSSSLLMLLDKTAPFVGSTHSNELKETKIICSLLWTIFLNLFSEVLNLFLLVIFFSDADYRTIRGSLDHDLKKYMSMRSWRNTILNADNDNLINNVELSSVIFHSFPRLIPGIKFLIMCSWCVVIDKQSCYFIIIF